MFTTVLYLVLFYLTNYGRAPMDSGSGSNSISMPTPRSGPVLCIGPLANVTSVRSRRIAAHHPITIVVGGLGVTRGMRANLTRTSVICRARIRNNVAHLVTIFRSVAGISGFNAIHSTHCPCISLTVKRGTVCIRRKRSRGCYGPRLGSARTFALDRNGTNRHSGGNLTSRRALCNENSSL